MILLDTNVISEVMRPKPSSAVIDWFDAVAGLPLFTTAITEAELWSGFHQLAEGQRKTVLEKMIAETLAEDFAGRILPFDSVAARVFGTISAERARRGRPISTADCQIAAIAVARGFQLATRNGRDFEHCGCDVINPWSGETGGP